MPEGHTLHRLALDLTGAFAGEQVRVSSPQGRFADSAALLDGQVVIGAEAWGKQLFVEFAGEQFVHIHLGLYGKLDLRPYATEPPLPVGQVRLRVTGSETYADLRGATTCNLVTAAQRDAVVAKLGPDPLRDDADPGLGWARVGRSRTTIAALLMDQSVLAGVGNVYRAEVLFRHRIDPMRPGNTLRRRQWDAIWDDLVELMKDGVEKNRIDTVRDEHTPEAMGRPPRKDDHGGEVYVYRRNGQPCLVCGTSVRTVELQQRNLFWCPRCQRPYRPRATPAK
ncbi:endonuclease-8 [Nocardioides albertanoniae]|uniref:DNA-(apurinic or apyrimidinic site) lyase n=1 Tax=Nocardioides albertanoniae TaxID=1175486 RepID=A0A543AAG3_9ACTN|nr:DNA-formamidopyrimidine glycosylase family protein [Nocardioides albertanoniae]TQL69598.1 endonuclease-8 [Nocardioides albertanoniae]